MRPIFSLWISPKDQEGLSHVSFVKKIDTKQLYPESRKEIRRIASVIQQRSAGMSRTELARIACAQELIVRKWLRQAEQ